METNETLDHVLDSLAPGSVLKKKKSPVMPVIYFLAGVMLFIVNSQMNYKSGEFLYPLNLTVGTVLVFVGLLIFFFRKYHYYDAKTGKMLKKREFYFDLKEQNQLVKLLETGKTEELGKLKRSVANTLKLRVTATSDGKWCFLEVLLFVPHQYQPLTAVVQLKDAQVKELFTSLQI